MIASSFAIWLAETGNVVVSAIVGGVASVVVAVIASVLNYRTKVDEGLRDTRLTLYKVLWKKTELLPKWPRRTDVTYEQLRGFSEELRKWYFDEGGIFLSRKARSAYGGLQDVIGAVLAPTEAKGPITDPDYDRVRSHCSDLRSQLTDDLLSRRGARHWF
jgi:hypothetical protein